MVPFYRTVELFANILRKADGWTKKTYLGRLGTLNHIILAIARRTGFLRRKGEEWELDYNKLSAFRNNRIIQMSVQWLGGIINWTGWASSGEDAGRKLADRWICELHANGFWGDRRSERNGTKHLPTKHYGVHVDTLLLLYEKLERLFIERFGWDALPKHKGAGVRSLFNAVFKGYQRFNRVPDDESKQQWETEENPISEDVETFWRNRLWLDWEKAYNDAEHRQKQRTFIAYLKD